MTYLELVNAVLRRLREKEVGTVSQTAYSKLIGDFINEAKAQIENAWDWSSLRTTLAVNTTSGVFNYELNGTQNNFEILDVWNDTSNVEMQPKSAHWFNAEFLTAAPQAGQPMFYNFNGVSADGDAQVDVYPVPDGVYSLLFNVSLRNRVLNDDNDVIYIPHRPVILTALAMAIEERGEDGGQQSVNAYGMASAAIADEISYDAARHPEDTVWYSV